MEPNHKKILKAVVLELRHMLEGYYNGTGWHGGDLEQRLNAIGVWRDRKPLPADELAGISAVDRNARKIVDAYLKLRDEAGVPRGEAVAEFVRETAYTWANRLLALRCMEARDLIDEVILQKPVYGGRSLEHNRLAQRCPELCTGEDDGLFATLNAALTKQAVHLPLLFDPKAPGVALKPSVAALKRTIALLSGAEAVRGQEPATAEMFRASDAFGWAYQYYQLEEKQRVDEWLKTKKGYKCEGPDIAPKTALYTESYIVKYLVQNSLGNLWAGIHPETDLPRGWEYFLREARRDPVEKKRVCEITFLDPACGSGHFLLEAFDVFYGMYKEEGLITDPEVICRAILEHNIYGIDIDERAVQISEAALWMKAAEKVLQTTGSTAFATVRLNLVATNIRLPKSVDHLKTFLEKHPEDKDLSSALEIVLNGLQKADELGSLLQIERPVEEKLKELQQQQERVVGIGGVQTHLYKATPIQGQLPVGTGSYIDWKDKALGRLEQHFNEESEIAEVSEAFFSSSVGRGLRLFDLLAKRYDVVSANPPYMGSGNMGPAVKTYIERHYSAGKRDLYAAFILRCVELCAMEGRVAMVTQQSWMFLRSYSELRVSSQDNSGLLESTTIETLAHLGEHAFDDSAAAGAFVVLFTIAKSSPSDEHVILALRLIGAKGAEEKARLLRSVAANELPALTSTPKQSEIVSVPQAPLSLYNLTQDFFRLLRRKSFGSAGDISQGPSPNVTRHVRFMWEVDDRCLDWVPYAKGGGYCKWFGFENHVARWPAFDADPQATVRGKKNFFREGLCYTTIARGKLGIRRLRSDTLFSDACSGIFSNLVDLDVLMGEWNTHSFTFLARAICGKLDFSEDYLRQLPAPSCASISKYVKVACELKERLAGSSLIERSFMPHSFNTASSLYGLIAQQMTDELATAAILHTIEAAIEDRVIAFYGWSEETVRLVISETGTPAGKFTLLSGYDSLPALCKLDTDQLGAEVLAATERRTFSDLQVAQLEDQIKQLYVSSSNVDTDSEEPSGPEGLDDETIATQIPIPPETFLENLSQKLELHPISVYQLLTAKVAKEGWRCVAEDQRLTQDHFSVVVLHLLGHRWPNQMESGEPEPEFADANSIIQVTEGTERTLLERVRERTEAEFEGGDVTAVEREFTEIMGVPLNQWLTHAFFEYHTSRFKKRPIAWQLESGRFYARRKPAFAALVYCHKVCAQTVTTIQSQYARPLRQRYETEMRGIESVPKNARSDRQQDRLSELMDLIAELRSFDENLEGLSRAGFGPEKLHPQLRQYSIDDAMLCLKSQWLDKLSAAIAAGPGEKWQQKAQDTRLHTSLAQWLADAMASLRHHCSEVGPKPPKQETLTTDPTATELATLISKDADNMVSGALESACAVWWKPLNEAVFAPLRAQIKEAKEEQKRLKEEDITKATDPHKRQREIATLIKELKENVRLWQRDLDEKTDKADKVRKLVLAWRCPEARDWGSWLSSQPMYDVVSSLDGIRQPPHTVADFVAQESMYAPDINDGVRVNIAPLQKAGLLAADVIASKDVDKAISDRAEWRADERRWCREGKLPQPGWWPLEKKHASGQD